jgi:hypothetical protein
MLPRTLGARRAAASAAHRKVWPVRARPLSIAALGREGGSPMTKLEAEPRGREGIRVSGPSLPRLRASPLAQPGT